MKARILGFHGRWSSGLGYLSVVDEDGVHHMVPVDNGPAVRALDQAFPGFITRDHAVDNEAIEGRVIEYSADSAGVLDDFELVENNFEARG